MVETTGRREQRGVRGRIGRRQVLRCLGALAAGALLKPSAAAARPEGEPTPPALPSVQTQLPDTREAALRSNRELIETCVARGNLLPADMPSRSVEEAVESCLVRRQAEAKRISTQANPLHDLLAATPLAESRLGLSHWPILDETEDHALGHFR